MENKLCHKCSIEKPKTSEFWHRDGARVDGLDTKCKACKSKHQKSFKAKMAQKRRDAKYYANNSEKPKARDEARRKFGSASKLMCASYNCGSMASEWHHFDYNFPLDVIPLCDKHHTMIHNY